MVKMALGEPKYERKRECQRETRERESVCVGVSGERYFLNISHMAMLLYIFIFNILDINV